MRTLGTLVALACSVALGRAETPRPAPRPLQAVSVGAFLSMTGAQATFGIATHEGIQLALDDHNARANAKGGRKIQLQLVDTAGKTSDAADAVTRLADNGVVAVIGEVASNLSLAGGAVAQKRGLPMVTPASTHPDVTQLGTMIARVVVLDAAQGRAMAKFAHQNLKLQKIATLVDAAQPYSSNLGDAFRAEYVKLGGTIVTAQTYTGGNNDFKLQLEAIVKSNAGAIYVPGYYPDVAQIAKQARALGINVPLLGGDGWDSEQLPTLAGKAIEGSYHTGHFAITDQRPIVKSFVAAFRAKYKHDPDALAALGYDAARVVASAIDRARSHNGADLSAAIRATTNHEGITGTITIDPTGDTKKSVAILKIANAKPVFEASITAR